MLILLEQYLKAYEVFCGGEPFMHAVHRYNDNSWAFWHLSIIKEYDYEIMAMRNMRNQKMKIWHYKTIKT